MERLFKLFNSVAPSEISMEMMDNIFYIQRYVFKEKEKKSKGIKKNVRKKEQKCKSE